MSITTPYRLTIVTEDLIKYSPQPGLTLTGTLNSRLSELIRCEFVLILIGFLLAGCSYTPGDAALRAGYPEAAADLYKKGAEEGDGVAALKLGLLLSEGHIPSARYGMASQWFRRACDHYVLAGCHNLGVSYEYGRGGVEKDYKQAFAYYRLAADRGYLQSQYNLGSLYSNKYVEPPDNVEGYKWMLLTQKKAQECRSQPLCKWILDDPPGHRSKLRARLTAQEIAQAQRLADEWVPKK